MKPQKLTIKKQFASALPKLPDDEYEDLKANIERDGCIIDPIVIWKDCVIDGHHRYRIAHELGMNFKVVIRTFKNDEEAIAWIEEHGAARRHMDPVRRRYLMGKSALRRKKKAEAANQSMKVAEPVAETAAEFKVTRRSVQSAMVLAEDIDSLAEPVKEQYTSGDLKATETEIKKLKKLTAAQQKKATKLVNSGKSKTLKAAMKAVTPEPEVVKKKNDELRKPKALQFDDQNIQKTYDGFRAMMRNMPQHLFDRVEGAATKMLKELRKLLDEG